MTPSASHRPTDHPGAPTTTATWLASGDGHVLAWVHQPAGSAVTGSVVIASPFGREAVPAYRSTHVIAAELVARGFAVVRFAWRGTADSSELAQTDVPAALAEDLHAVRELAASIVPDAPVHGIGLRIGASVLAASTEQWGHRIACDPVAGRAFVREQAALRKLSIPTQPVEDLTELVGLALSPEQAVSLRALRVTEADSVHTIELAPQVAERLYRVEPAYAETPRAQIIELVQSFPTQPATRAAWTPTTERVADGVREELVEVGQHALPGILVTPASEAVKSVAMLCAPGAEPKDGPTGLSTVIARDIALHGAASLRVDRRGSGELLDVRSNVETNPYRPGDIDDIVAATEYLQSKYPQRPLYGVALCSGGWLLAMTARQIHFDALLLVNVIAWSTSFRFWAAMYDRMISRRAFMVKPRTESAQGLLQRARTTKRAAVRLGAKFLRALPDPLWKQLSRVGLRQDPRMLLDEVSPTTQIKLCFGPEDLPLWVDFHGPQAVRDLRRSGHQIEVDHVDALDHAALGQAGRRWIRTRIDELVQAPPSGRR